MSLLGLIKGKGPNGFGYSSTAALVTEGLDLSGRTVLVTGASSGLGLETVRVLSSRGARIIGTGRTVQSVQAACAGIVPKILPLACELSDPASVRACVRAVEADGAKLDAIIANAGIMALPKLTQAFGLEMQFLTNHIGHFMLVTGLLKSLATNGRVAILSSAAHTQAPKDGIQFDNLSWDRNYGPWTAYGHSKLANLLFARELSRRLKPGQTANSIHPGVIRTNLGRNLPAGAAVVFAMAGPLVLKDVHEGAATQTYVAVHPAAANSTGQYFADCNVAKGSRVSTDDAMAARLWEVSEKIVAGLA